MAYRCPLCADPHPDAEHLANHLAFTALLGDDDHEEWLDEQAPGWENEDEPGLAGRLRDVVDTVEHPIDDVETVDHGGHDHAEDDGPTSAHDPRVTSETVRSGVDRGPGAIDAEAQDIVAEARELTREMGTDEPGDEDATDGDGSASVEGEAETE